MPTRFGASGSCYVPAMSHRTLRTVLLVFPGLVVFGTLGYMAIEGWNPVDSAYMTMITLSTVGFSEVHSLSPLGKLFTSVLILLGVGTLAYTATRATEAILERGLFRRRRMNREIRNLDRHVVVCGFGRMGRTVVDQVRARGVPTVIVEKDPQICEQLLEDGIPHVRGDATDDASLVAAGTERARSLATVLQHDADNLFVTLTARKLNPDLTIIARSSSSKNDAKMLTAGATRVLNPYSNGGRLMAQQLLHPSVTEFIDAISTWGGADLGLEEVQVQPGSKLAGQTIRDAPIRAELDIIVVSVRGGDGATRFNPAPDLRLEAGDTLVGLGRRDNLRLLARLAGA